MTPAEIISGISQLHMRAAIMIYFTSCQGNETQEYFLFVVNTDLRKFYFHANTVNTLKIYQFHLLLQSMEILKNDCK